MSNSTDTEGTNASLWGFLSSFNSNGFTITGGSDGANSLLWGNKTSDAYVAWNWKANGAGVSNTAGSITSSVSANTSAGFSVVTYTGTGSNATVGHGLGVAPRMIIVKNRSAVNNWAVYHASLGATGRITLDETGAFTTSSTSWNNTAPTSTVFSLGSAAAGNGSGNGMVAYCFSQVAGYSAFGSYTGNGSADGPFIYTGFRPRYVMVKQSSASGNGWNIFDSARDPANLANDALFANATTTETANNDNSFDLVSNGFKTRGNGASVNTNGATYVYMAFAESPFNYSNAR
jgi:hypothetical protein